MKPAACALPFPDARRRCNAKRQTATPGREWPFNLRYCWLVRREPNIDFSATLATVMLSPLTVPVTVTLFPTQSLELVLGVKLVDFSLRNQDVRGPAGNALLDAFRSRVTSGRVFHPTMRVTHRPGNGFVPQRINWQTPRPQKPRALSSSSEFLLWGCYSSLKALTRSAIGICAHFRSPPDGKRVYQRSAPLRL